MTIQSIVFKRDGKLMAYGDCPNTRYKCDGAIYYVGSGLLKDYTCTACSRSFAYDELNIREANDTETSAYNSEVEYKKAVDSDKTKANQIITWWGFEMPREFGVNESPGGYLNYEVYLSLVKKIFPDEQPLSKTDFGERVWRIWR